MNTDIDIKKYKSIDLKEFIDAVLEEYKGKAGTDSTTDHDSPNYEALLEIDKLFKNFCSVSQYEKPKDISEFTKDKGDLILSEIEKLDNAVLASAIVKTIRKHNASESIEIKAWAQKDKFDTAIKDRFETAKMSLNQYLKNHYKEKDKSQNDKWEDYIDEDMRALFLEQEEKAFKILGGKSGINIASFLVWALEKKVYFVKDIQKKWNPNEVDIPAADLEKFGRLRYQTELKSQLHPKERETRKKKIEAVNRGYKVPVV